MSASALKEINMAKVPQLYLREPKSVTLFQAEPVFKNLPNFEQPDATTDTRCAQYILGGKGFVYTSPDGLNVIDTVTGLLLIKIPIKDVFEINISPLGNYITTWSKLTKDETGEKYIPNVNIIKFIENGSNYKILHSFLNKTQNGWIPQFTGDESIVAFFKNSYSINFHKLVNFDFSKPLNTLDVSKIGKISNFEISQGLNPSIAIFIPAEKSNPATIKIYSLSNLKKPVSEKQFFKGEECQFKWNSIGTSLLALVSTAFDSTNKSYYGENQLYLLDIQGLFVQKIALNNDSSPIHEITWSPTSREFAVIHDFMPTTTTFFDSRGNSIHSLPKESRNTIIYSPHAKFILVAGFGNLPGDIDILDRQNKFKKIISFKAPNTSVCKWSPDGRFILTATTSPRLRVDNSIKIWYFNGTLMYIKKFQELNAVDWRAQPLNDFPPINLSKADQLDCLQDQSALEYLNNEKNKSVTKKASTGAYRPPHARNKVAGSTGRSLADLHEQAQNGRGKSVIPGYTPTEEKSSTESMSKAALKNRRKRANKKENESKESVPAPSATNTSNPSDLVVGGVFSIEEKKIRNLLKKLRAIEALKVKQVNGEFLEDTQVLKISTEDAVRKELESLGWSEDNE